MPDLGERIRMAEKAGEEFAPDSVLYLALEDLSEQYVREWRNSGKYDLEKREDIHRRLEALNEIRNAIERRIADGPMAKAELAVRERERRVEDVNWRPPQVEDNDDA